VGTTPLTLSQSGDTLQSLAARAGADWKAVAAANNIDNPRLVEPGTVLDLKAGVKLG
jgi:nucleoid-associated protein YgaU